MTTLQLSPARAPATPALSFMPVRSGLLQRKCACGGTPGPTGECETCRKKKLQQRQANPPASPTVHYPGASVSEVPPIVNEVLRSPGQPLDPATRAFMEPRFGHDFSQVHIHHDARAAESAQAVDAQAYAAGRDVVFDAGQHRPDTTAGQKLIAHELAHVMQQSASSSAGFLSIGNSNSVAEQEAEQVSNQVVRGENPPQELARHPVGLQRQARATPSPQPTQQPARRQTSAILSSVAGIRLGGFGNFDAELDRRAALDPQRRSANEPCRVTLTVRVKFDFEDAQTPTRWTPAEQSRWQNEFIRIVTDRWSFRFLLAPSERCAGEPCQLAAAVVNVQPVTSNAHHPITIFYDKPPGARSDVETLYRADVERSGSDLRTNQTTAAHEAGHMLGLSHVHCRSNHDECYGTNREEGADVMGRGEIVTERDYFPFVSALQQITTCSWQVRGGGRGPLFGNASTALGITLGLFGGIVGGVLGAAGGPLGAVLGAVAGAALGAAGGYAIGQGLLD